MVKKKRFFLFVLMICLFVACGDGGEDETTVVAPTASVTAEVVVGVTEEAVEELAATATVTAVPATVPPIVEATPEPIGVGMAGAVPLAVGAAVETFVTDNQFLFRWQEGEADVMIGVNDGQRVAEWIYAVVVPFATVTDGISAADLAAAWQAGEILMDEGTTAVFTELWGGPEVSTVPVEGEDLVAELWERQADSGERVLGIVPFERLVPELKVLAVEGLSPLAADFDAAVYPLTVPIGLVGVEEDVALLGLRWPEPLTNRQADLLTTIGMTGPAGMRRAVADRMEKYGLTYPAEVTGPVLQAVDIAHMSNENAFASDCPFPDPFDSANVCNRDEYVELMTWMGIDINEMTGNHLNDWGIEALLHTFDLYDAAGIQTFGGGRDLAAAQAPLLIEHHGNRLAFVGCNPVGPPSGWAAENYPGSTPCTDDYGFLLNQIQELDAAGYLVFATVQYAEYYQYETTAVQRTDFHNLAAAGATAVSGSQGHHPQGFSFFGDSFIHYGLGNLLADQMFSLATRQTFIDIYTVYDGRLISVELWTGLIEDFARQRLMTAEEREDLLESVFEASDWACCGE